MTADNWVRVETDIRNYYIVGRGPVGELWPRMFLIRTKFNPKRLPT